MSRYAGLDLSMEATAICVFDDKGNRITAVKVESRRRSQGRLRMPVPLSVP